MQSKVKAIYWKTVTFLNESPSGTLCHAQSPLLYQYITAFTLLFFKNVFDGTWAVCCKLYIVLVTSECIRCISSPVKPCSMFPSEVPSCTYTQQQVKTSLSNLFHSIVPLAFCPQWVSECSWLSQSQSSPLQITIPEVLYINLLFWSYACQKRWGMIRSPAHSAHFFGSLL